MASEPASAGGYLHGTAVVIAEAGVLVRGPSGSGKSALALALLAAAEQRGLFVRLVGDDRVSLSQCSNRLVARAHPSVAGLIEERGTGLLSVLHEPSAVIRLVVELSGHSSREQPPRLPEAGLKSIEIAGVLVPRMAFGSEVSALEGARRILSQVCPD